MRGLFDSAFSFCCLCVLAVGAVATPSAKVIWNGLVRVNVDGQSLDDVRPRTSCFACGALVPVDAFQGLLRCPACGHGHPPACTVE